MVAEKLINYMIPPLKPTDDISKAKLWMDELHLSQLPVVKQGVYLGIVSDEMLFDEHVGGGLVGDYPLLGTDVSVNFNSHFYEVLKSVGRNGYKIVAVLDDDHQFLGVIATIDLLELFSQTSAIASPGAIIEIKLNAKDYSLSEISRIIEMHEAQIISSYLNDYPFDPSKLLLTLKLNIEDVGRVIASLNNYGYEIEASYNTINASFDEKERLDIFMKFLRI